MVDFKQKIIRLSQELENLPGESAHIDMLPFRIKTSEALKKTTNYKLSATLLLLYEKDGLPHFILTERQTYAGKHSGQISFPGGKTEPFDATTAQTALRETKEELGIDPTKITLMGKLTEVYIPVSNFLIHPYIGFVAQLPPLSPDSYEVKEVLHVSCNDLLANKSRIKTDIPVENGRVIKQIPAFNLTDRIVWGATAIILNEFKYILKRI